jgi:hypothetical protein
MSLALTITDNADATGGTATIIGSDVASLNTVYVSPVHRGNNNLAWRAVATLTGDGTVAVPVAPEYYFAYASGLVGGLLAFSPPIIFAANFAGASIQEQVEAAIAAKIQTLTLSGLSTPPGDLPPERVYRFPALTGSLIGTQIVLPAVVVTTGNASEVVEYSLLNTDMVSYPVDVWILDRAAPHYTVPYPTYSLWRQQIHRRLRFQRLAGFGQVLKVVPEPGEPILSWKPPEYEIIYSGIRFRATNREGRV